MNKLDSQRYDLITQSFNNATEAKEKSKKINYDLLCIAKAFDLNRNPQMAEEIRKIAKDIEDMASFAYRVHTTMADIYSLPRK